MRCFIILASLPVMLFALTKVNLIRNAGFEQESYWLLELASHEEPNTAQGSPHDDSDCYSGDYSASGDTRTTPPWQQFNTGVNFTIHQEFITPKTLEDVDSISWHQRVEFKDNSHYNGEACMIALRYEQGTMWADSGICYGFMKPIYTYLDGWVDVSVNFSPEDTAWRFYERSYAEDFGSRFGIDTAHFSEFVLTGYGWWLQDWSGQKIWFDDVRLMGWADYDIALTRITGDLANPAVMVHNNGREAQSPVVVIASIEDSASIIYLDTVELELTSDDSLEVSFDSWNPTPLTEYTLTIRTGSAAGMTTDECDENDIITEEYHSSIFEDETTCHPVLEILSAVGPQVKLRFSGANLSKGECISIFDASGRKVDELHSSQTSGVITWGEGRNPGVYFIVPSTGNTTASKVILVE